GGPPLCADDANVGAAEAVRVTGQLGAGIAHRDAPAGVLPGVQPEEEVDDARDLPVSPRASGHWNPLSIDELPPLRIRVDLGGLLEGHPPWECAMAFDRAHGAQYSVGAAGLAMCDPALSCPAARAAREPLRTWASRPKKN